MLSASGEKAFVSYTHINLCLNQSTSIIRIARTDHFYHKYNSQAGKYDVKCLLQDK